MIDKIAKFKKLKTREKVLILGLATTLIFSLYFQMVYKPIASETKRYKFQIDKQKARLDELEVKTPVIGKQKESIVTLESQTEKMEKEIAQIEDQLPSKANTSGLLTEIMRQTQSLELASASQKMQESNDLSQIFIELRFNADYKATINFINRVESISSFLINEEMEISEPKTKDAQRDTTTARVLISSVLGNGQADFSKSNKSPKDLKIKRDIFVSNKKPAAQIRKVDLKLEGVSFLAAGSTAILNSEVVRVGSEIKGYTVKEISLNSIIVTDGTNDHVLAIER